MTSHPLAYKYYDLLVVFFVVFLVVSNIVATKLLAIGPFIMDGGALLFPLTYVIGDVLAEVYGFRRARRAIIVAFIASIVVALTFFVVQILPGAQEYVNQASYEAVLGFVPMIVIASLAAFTVGQLINAYVLTAMKRRWGEKNLWIRLLGSTIAGEFFDTLIFCSIAFYGILTGGAFINYVIVGVLYKVAIEALLLPITYRVIAVVKRRESLESAKS